LIIYSLEKKTRRGKKGDRGDSVLLDAFHKREKTSAAQGRGTCEVLSCPREEGEAREKRKSGTRAGAGARGRKKERGRKDPAALPLLPGGKKRGMGIGGTAVVTTATTSKPWGKKGKEKIRQGLISPLTHEEGKKRKLHGKKGRDFILGGKKQSALQEGKSGKVPVIVITSAEKERESVRATLAIGGRGGVSEETCRKTSCDREVKKRGGKRSLSFTIPRGGGGIVQKAHARRPRAGEKKEKGKVQTPLSEGGSETDARRPSPGQKGEGGGQGKGLPIILYGGGSEEGGRCFAMLGEKEDHALYVTSEKRNPTRKREARGSAASISRGAPVRKEGGRSRDKAPNRGKKGKKGVTSKGEQSCCCIRITGKKKKRGAEAFLLHLGTRGGEEEG